MLRIGDIEVTIGHFPDGTLSLGEKFNDWAILICKAECYKMITWQYEKEEELIALIYLTRHLQQCGINNIKLVMPYIPNARMDRVRDVECDVFTLKYFSEIINSLNFESVIVLDPHSSVGEALINNIQAENPEVYIDMAIQKINSRDLTVFYPDEGAMKRYQGLITRRYSFGVKRRDWASGDIEGLDVIGEMSDINGHDVLIIDDICSRGGTFYHSAKKLKELGAKNIYLYVTHCENTILDGELLKSGLIEKVFTTSSIFTKQHEKVEVLDYDEH